jgi:hypothetical protein
VYFVFSCDTDDEKDGGGAIFCRGTHKNLHTDLGSNSGPSESEFRISCHTNTPSSLCACTPIHVTLEPTSLLQSC